MSEHILLNALPTSVSSPMPLTPAAEPNADKQKDIAVMKDWIRVLQAERGAHGLTEQQTEELDKLFLDSLRARGFVPE